MPNYTAGFPHIWDSWPIAARWTCLRFPETLRDAMSDVLREKLREAMVPRKMRTWADLAERAGVKERTLNRLLAGHPSRAL